MGQLISGCEEAVLAEAVDCAVKLSVTVGFAMELEVFTVPDTADDAVLTPEPASQLSTVIENGGSDNPPLTSEALSV